MSTEYILLDKGDDTSVSILEHSGKFDLGIYIEDFSVDLCDLTLEDLKQMNQKLVDVISYFDTEYDGCKTSY